LCSSRCGQGFQFLCHLGNKKPQHWADQADHRRSKSAPSAPGFPLPAAGDIHPFAFFPPEIFEINMINAFTRKIETDGPMGEKNFGEQHIDSSTIASSSCKARLTCTAVFFSLKRVGKYTQVIKNVIQMSFRSHSNFGWQMLCENVFKRKTVETSKKRQNESTMAPRKSTPCWLFRHVANPDSRPAYISHRN